MRYPHYPVTKKMMKMMKKTSSRRSKERHNVVDSVKDYTLEKKDIMLLIQ